METYATLVKFVSGTEVDEIPTRRHEWLDGFNDSVKETGGKVGCAHFAPLGGYDAMFITEIPADRAKEFSVRLSLLPGAERTILTPASEPSQYFSIVDQLALRTQSAPAQAQTSRR